MNLLKHSFRIYYGCVLPGMLIIANEAISCELNEQVPYKRGVRAKKNGDGINYYKNGRLANAKVTLVFGVRRTRNLAG